MTKNSFEDPAVGGVSRREFIAGAGLAAGGLLVGGGMLTPGVAAAATLTVVNTGATVHHSNTGGGWWTPIAHHNGATYMAYIDQDLNTVVTKRDASGSWSSAIVGVDTTIDHGHTQPSLAVDGDGFIHVWFNMHDDPMVYKRSNQSESVTGGFTNKAWEIAQVAVNAVFTYPMATTTPNGDVYLLIRDSSRGELFRWNNATNKWSGFGWFGNENGFYFYPGGIVADSVGDIHMSFEWAKQITRPERHLGSYVRYSPADGKFYQADGSAQALPITRANSDVFQPMQPTEDWEKWGIQGSRIAVDGNDRPVIAYGYSPNNTMAGIERRFAHWTGNAWDRDTIQPTSGDRLKPWISASGNTFRYYYPSASDDEVYLRVSTDGGVSWAPAENLTDGLLQQVNSLPGFSTGDTDYLYLNDRVSSVGGPLYLGIVGTGGGGENTNLAPSATLIEDGTSAEGTNTKDKAVDGIKNSNDSRWVTSATVAEPYGLQLHWPSAQTISAVKIWSGNMSQAGWQIVRLQMQYFNGTSWVGIPGTLVDGNTKDGFNGQFNDLSFTPVTAEKVRLWITDGVDQGDRTNARLLEIEVWGN